MVVLPDRPDRIAQAIFGVYVEREKDWRRPHLGASSIGDENCRRLLWYRFRWAARRPLDGRVLRLFERGNREEDWIVEDLRAAGLQVEAVDPETGEQREMWFWGGHFGGSCDGIVLGVPDAPKTWHLLECKTSNKDKFRDLLKQGVRKAQPGHYAQMQTYMHGLKLKRALYICVCKDDDRIYSERLHYDRTFAEALIEKAQLVIASPEPLTRISEDPSWFECKLCDYRDICHLRRHEQLERNCRTCVSSTPTEDGRWICEHHQAELSIEAQKDGCAHHLLIPTLLPWPAVAADTEQRSIEYATDSGKIIDRNGKLQEVP